MACKADLREEKCVKKLEFIDKIRVQSPCSEEWNEMAGNAKIRFCSHCSKNVNNISEMSRKEAMRLVRRANGRLCVRYHIDQKTGGPIFLETFHKIARRSPAMAAGVLATSFAASSVGYAQSEPPWPRMQVEIVQKIERAPATLSGYVTDPKGAAIPYAVVSLVNEKTFDYRAVNASFEGFYEFNDVQSGEYTLKFEGGGFEAKEIKGITVNGEEIRRDASLVIPTVAETVTIGGDDELRETVLVGVIACSIDYVASNPLVQAAVNDDLDEVKARVIMRAKVNARDKSANGISPLHAAVENGNLEMIQFLLDHGAKVNIRDSDKRTPLMMMDGDATEEILDLLVRYGAKMQLADKEKNTVLHHLVQNTSNESLIAMLINLGVSVNAVNKSGQTALMLAAGNDNEESVKKLLESGADVNLLDREGRSAWDVAGTSEVRRMLETYGAIARVEQ
jgi:ankyrin repeat protein